MKGTKKEFLNDMGYFVLENFVEPLFRDVGLLQSPSKRFAVIGGLTAAILYATKPKGLFQEDGTSRPWVVTSQNDKMAVPLPVLGVAMIPAFLSILLL